MGTRWVDGYEVGTRVKGGYEGYEGYEVGTR